MRLVVCLAAVLTTVSTIAAQDFVMIEPSGDVAARVEIRPGRMVVYELTGERLYFSREPGYDTIDGRFVGYFNSPLNRIIRFPRSGVGPMQSSDLDDFAPVYRLTRRIVRPADPLVAGSNPHFGIGVPGYLDPNFPGPFIPTPFIPTPGFGGAYPIGPPLPQSVLIDSQSIPNPPLSPVRIELRNGGPREVQIGVVDLLKPGKTRSIRLGPGQSFEVSLERDAGARQIQNYRVITPLGDSITREVVNDVPPAVRYEIVVHEWQIQSVAIDRTAGAGDNPIEDINFSGKPLGRFPLPPGAELQPGSIDVYRASRARGDDGTITPILAEEDDRDAGPGPLERAILDAQRNAQRGR